MSPQERSPMFKKYSIHAIALLTLTQNLVCMENAEEIKPQDLSSNELTIQSFIDIQKKQTHLILNNVDARIIGWAGKVIDTSVFLQGLDRDNRHLAYIRICANGDAHLHTPTLVSRITQQPNGYTYLDMKSIMAIRHAKIALTGNECWDTLVATITKDSNTTQYGTMTTTITCDHAIKN